MYKYAEFYCMQNVNMLREALNQFQRDFYNEFQIDAFNELVISGIANQVFHQRGYESNENLYEVSGHVQHFIKKL